MKIVKGNNVMYFIKKKVNRLLENTLNRIFDKIDLEKVSIVSELRSTFEKDIDFILKKIESDMNMHTNEIKNASSVTIEYMEKTTDILNNLLKNIIEHLNEDKLKYKEDENIKVVFFIQISQVWNSLKSVYNYMQNNQKINVTVVLLPFLSSNNSVSKYYFDLKKFFIDEEIPFINYNYYSLEKHRPHVVFVQNPYEETRPQRFRISEILKCKAKICYVNYGLNISESMWDIQAAFNLEFYKVAWRIFAISDHDKSMFGRYLESGNSNVVVTGHPKFDSHKLFNKNKNKKLLEKISGRKTFLWTPHFSVRSTYNIYSKIILEQFNQRKDLFLIVRPHPLFFYSMKSNNIWSDNDEISFRNIIELSENVFLDESVDYLEAFQISDALMADSGSFLLEYLPSLKPILYLHHPEGLGLYDKNFENILYKANNNEDIIDFIDMVSKSEDFKLQERKESISKYLFGLNGNIAENIVEHIISEFSKKNFHVPNLIKQNLIEDKVFENTKCKIDNILRQDEYYFSKKKILESLCQSIESRSNAIHIGCGDGKDTFLLAKYFKKVIAYDEKYSIICEAKKDVCVKNIEFIHSKISDIKPNEKYDLVTFTGLSSGIIDDLEFLYILNNLKILVKNTGYIILIDSLSIEKDKMVKDDEGHLSKYRSISDYKYLLDKNGFELIEEYQIICISENRIANSVFFFKNKEEVYNK